MAIPEELLQDVEAYCVEPDPDEAALRALHLAWDEAEAYLQGAGICRPDPAAARHGLWLGVMLALTLDGYDQRGAQFETGKLQDNPAFRRKISQLKWTEPVSNSDTTGEGNP